MTIQAIINERARAYLMNYFNQNPTIITVYEWSEIAEMDFHEICDVLDWYFLTHEVREILMEILKDLDGYQEGMVADSIVDNVYNDKFKIHIDDRKNRIEFNPRCPNDNLDMYTTYYNRATKKCYTVYRPGEY